MGTQSTRILNVSKSQNLSKINRTRKNQSRSKSINQTKKSFLQDMEAVYSDQAEYLSIGDTVLIKFTHKIFQNDVDLNE